VFTFIFRYSDGGNELIKNVTSAVVYDADHRQKLLTGSEILEWNFRPYGIVILRSEKGNCTISCEGVRAIYITAEK
jgi:hypothetical protein